MSELIEAVITAFPELKEYIEDPDVNAISIRATGQIYALRGDGSPEKVSHSIEAQDQIKRIVQRLRERGGDTKETDYPILEYADADGNRIVRIIDTVPALSGIAITKNSSASTNMLNLTEEVLGYDASQWLNLVVNSHSMGIGVVSQSLFEREMFVEAFARKACVDRNTVLIGEFPRVYIGNNVPVYLWRRVENKELDIINIAASLLPQTIAVAELNAEQFAEAVHITRARRARFVGGLPFANSTVALNGLMSWARISWKSIPDEKRAEIIAWFVKYIVTCDRNTSGNVEIESIKAVRAQKDKLLATALFTATSSGLIATEAGRLELDKLRSAEQGRVSSSLKIGRAPSAPAPKAPPPEPAEKELQKSGDVKPITDEAPIATPPKPAAPAVAPAPPPKPAAARSSIFASLMAEASVATGKAPGSPRAAPPKPQAPMLTDMPQAAKAISSEEHLSDLTDRYISPEEALAEKRAQKGAKEEVVEELNEADFEMVEGEEDLNAGPKKDSGLENEEELLIDDESLSDESIEGKSKENKPS